LCSGTGRPLAPELVQLRDSLPTLSVMTVTEQPSRAMAARGALVAFRLRQLSKVLRSTQLIGKVGSGSTPAVTGAVLVGTLIIFGASRNVGEARSWFARLRHFVPARKDQRHNAPGLLRPFRIVSPLAIETSRLLFGVDREAYKLALNACREARAAALQDAAVT
jgi:hypothetical protein